MSFDKHCAAISLLPWRLIPDKFNGSLRAPGISQFKQDAYRRQRGRCRIRLNVQINGNANVNNQYSITNGPCLQIKGKNVRIKASVRAPSNSS